MVKKETIGAKKETEALETEKGLNKFFSFFKKYSNLIYGIVIAILVIVIGLIAFNRYYLTPKSEQASSLMTQPLAYISQGDSASYMLALEGDEENEGLLSIISSYKMTATANTAKYLAGVCYFNLKDYDEALNYLLKFKHKEDIFWYACQEVIGDCYDEMEDTKKAFEYYNKALKGNENPFFAPNVLFKLGQLYEREENWDKAFECYQTIKTDYAEQYAITSIDKYYERAKIKAGK